MRRAAVIGALALLLGGCGGSDRPPPKQTDKEVIGGWIAALNAGDYVAAASYFAKDAVVEQSEEFRLRTREAAEEFNRSLPCTANLTDVKDEGKTTLAAFRLRAGPGGPCHGRARVRFTIRHGKFTEWRQLPEPEPGPVA
ncbi:MAG TPA: nuclear transport factor 2 family protein [Thermoleophilaceae bacterium]|nr:nuclear transport factor 2 family protein [Thermoleophilaceae bacterium]